VDGVILVEQGEICEPLRLAPAAKARLRMEVHALGSYAMTRYEVLLREPTKTLVALYPETGRQHQLRVHLAYLGHPIIGDKLYQMGEEFFIKYCDGSLTAEEEARLPSLRMLLHAESLRITSPTGAVLQIKAPLPAAFGVDPQIVDLLWQRKLSL
jgi:23S rRNA-/tRNA-specific pseudouridylate synthase